MLAVKTDKITGDALGTGRRKTAVARVRVRGGSGKVTVNGRAMDDFFHVEGDRRVILDVLQAVGKTDSVDVVIRVAGGGPSGQAGACRMGIARALISYDTGLFTVLRDGRFLTRDSRMKERKKYGLHGARRGVQFSKR
jgi:small subunit ribosomal protein S9